MPCLEGIITLHNGLRVVLLHVLQREVFRSLLHFRVLLILILQSRILWALLLLLSRVLIIPCLLRCLQRVIRCSLLLLCHGLFLMLRLRLQVFEILCMRLPLLIFIWLICGLLLLLLLLFWQLLSVSMLLVV